MNGFKLFVKDTCSDKMFEYPCINSNNNILDGKKVSVFGNECDKIVEFLRICNANVTFNPSNKETSFSQIGIVFPKDVKEDTEEGYYHIVDYYVETLQLLIHKMSGVDEFTHIVAVLPPQSDEMGISFHKMAYYAVYGLVQGLGELNAPQRIIINGIIPSDSTNSDLLINWIKFLSSNNANNIVGQIIKL